MWVAVWVGAVRGRQILKCCPRDLGLLPSGACGDPSAFSTAASSVLPSTLLSVVPSTASSVVPSTAPSVVPSTAPSLEEAEVGRPSCPYSFYLEFLSPDGYLLYPNDTLHSPTTGETLVYPEFCLDLYAESGEEVMLGCYTPMEGPPRVYPLGMLLSLPFLLATLVVYALLRDLRNLSGRYLMCQVLSLTLAYVALTTLQLFSEDMEDWACYTLGYMVQYFFLVTFFWLNVMCIDIFLTIGRVRGGGGGGLGRFLWYSCYAWGCPALIASLTAIVDNIALLHDPDNLFKPNIGDPTCFFRTKESQGVYFYGPMGVVVVSNTGMFLVTSLRIRDHRKQTRVLRSRDSMKHYTNSRDRERFNLYLKLLLVMGVNWLLELVSWLVGGPQELWYVPDVSNTLQGVFIFVIFVCKRRVVRRFSERLPGRSLPPDTTSSQMPSVGQTPL